MWEYGSVWVNMMANPDAWCGPSQLRESSPDYDPQTPTPTHSDSPSHSTGEEPPCVS
jgi:hypothetical protein